MSESALRIGIITAGELRHWQAQGIKALLEIPGVELVFRLEQEDADHAEKLPYLYQWWLSERAGKRIAGLGNSSTLLNGIPRIPLRDAPSATELDVLRAHRPDVLINFAPRALPESLMGLPPSGAWGFVLGDRSPGQHDIPGFQETLNDGTVVTPSLVRWPSGPGTCSVLRSASFGTSGSALEEIADNVLQCCAGWPAQVCREMLAVGPDAATGARMDPLAPPASAPTNAAMLQWLWKQYIGRKRVAGATSPEEWNFGVLPQPIASLLEDRPSLNVRWLPPPGSGRSRSTPFGCMQDGHLSVLYEKADRELNSAVIGRLRPKRDNNLKRSRSMLEGDGRISYPFTVEHAGEVYVIPEHVKSGQVTLFSLNKEQTLLTPLRTLLEEPLFSPTLFPHHGRWWLFGTKAPQENLSLHAFHAEHIEGPYFPHSGNPIKTDIRSARPGGTPFRRGEELWRPAQDHSVTGTIRIAFNRVTQLTPDRFAEETVRFFDPLKAPWSKGIRTISAVGDITLVDGMRHSAGKNTRKSPAERAARKDPELDQDDLNAL